MTTASDTAASPPDRPVRLCLLGDAGSIHTQRWARHFAARGYDVHLLSLRPAVIEGVMVHHFVPSLPTKLGYLTVVPKLRGMVRHLKPDLLHAHYLTSYGLLGLLTGWRPFLVSMWGSDVLDFPFKSPLHRWLVGLILRKADLLMSTSEAMVRTVTPWLPPGRPVPVTPFGVDVDLYHPAENEPGDGTVVIGTSCFLIPRKRIDLLLRAAATLIKRPDGPPIRVRIAGTGEEEANLKALAESLGIADRVEWLGWLSGEAHAAALRSYSVMVVPSRQEAFGVVAVEAAASGVPMIATKVDGFVESVSEGVSGLLVPPEDEAALTAALAELVDDGEKRRAMGRSAREWVVRTFAWDRCAERMQALYDEVLRQRLR